LIFCWSRQVAFISERSNGCFQKLPAKSWRIVYQIAFAIEVF